MIFEFAQRLDTTVMRIIDHELQENPIYFYKFIDPHYNESLDPIKREWRAYKETPKGYWIVPVYDVYGQGVDLTKKRWIAKEHQTTGQFAYAEESEALYSYYRRKLEHLRHLERKHIQLKAIVRKIENDNDIFGEHRPLLQDIRHIRRMMHRRDTVKPLKRKRILDDFIDEMEMVI